MVSVSSETEERMTETSLNRLSGDLAALVLDETDSDAVLVASNGDRLPVHSLLLKARSPYFRVLLSSKWKAGRETRLEVGKEALTMIITFLYSGKLQMEGLAVELLFEVLDNARMMGITDLEKEIEDFIILNLVAQSGPKEAKVVFNVLNHGVEHQFPEVVEACLAACQELLESSAMELPDGQFWQLEKGVWSETHILTPSSLAVLFPSLSPLLVSWILSFSLQEDFWKGREVEVLESIGEEIRDEALEMLGTKVLVSMLGFAGGWELGSRVGQVLVAKEGRLRGRTRELEEELEVEKEERESEVRRFEQLKAGSKAKDRRILSLERFVADMSKALQGARMP